MQLFEDRAEQPCDHRKRFLGGVADLGDFLEIQLTTYQAIQCPKSSLTEIKVHLKGDTYVGKERRGFDIQVGAK